jgi:7,8-dihydroneopterin aldolase/epimerase/oxygenase
LKLELDLEDASKNDDLSKTINYAEVYDIVSNEMKIKSKLIENIAFRIIASIKKSFPHIKSINIKVHKPNSPIA